MSYCSSVYSERPLERSCHGAAHVVCKERERTTNPTQHKPDAPRSRQPLTLLPIRLDSTWLGSVRLASPRFASFPSPRAVPLRLVSSRFVSSRILSCRLACPVPLRHVAPRRVVVVKRARRHAFGYARPEPEATRSDPRQLVTIPTTTSTPIRARFDRTVASLPVLHRPYDAIDCCKEVHGFRTSNHLNGR